jgi:hypothetical protein
MTNEEILLEFQKFTNEESAKVTARYEARIKELESEIKVQMVAPKWNLKPNFSASITDVTPEGYGN